jgi:alpha-amylase/alpha-mannosidase (GH57 family)
MGRHVCIHGHFYQPPRENPWLEEVELQDSAHPYHDWNERITAECYAPNTASRILDREKRIIDIVNNYSKISFNFGPTLLAWMERHQPEVYQAILYADIASRERFSGHGSALAQCFSHMIMPLANSADKRTQVLWGIRDFEHRFKRRPEGMWLPETAVDLETLDLLAEQGILFTILAPRQARQVRKYGGKKWRDVSDGGIDPKRPYLCHLPSGRTIALFFYDGPISQDLAFGDLLESGEAFARRLASAFVDGRDESQLVHIASDGESYGHHHKFGDMALAYGLHLLESEGRAELVNYGQYLEKSPPAHEVEIFENSSWSCAHGVERWRNDCGCKAGRGPGWHQKWRAPLREALDWLRDSLARIFEDRASPLLENPWAARDAYIGILLDRSPGNVASFLDAKRRKDLSPEEKTRALKLLEIERHAMLMFTSCGWFFDEITGIETVQVLQYAARAAQLAKEAGGTDLEPELIARLERAPSNDPAIGNGAVAYERYVKPAEVDLLRAGVHYAVSSVFEKYSPITEIYCYVMEQEAYEEFVSGSQKLAVGRVLVRSKLTAEEDAVSFAVLHLGEHNLMAAAREFMGTEAYEMMRKDLAGSFERGDLAAVTRLFEVHFSGMGYSLWHLFRDEQRKILLQIFDSAMAEINDSFRRIYGHHGAILQVAEKLRTPLPRALAAVAEFVLNLEIREALESGAVDVPKLRKAVADIGRYALKIDRAALGFMVSGKAEALMGRLEENPEDPANIERVLGLLEAVAALSLDLNLWKSQNVYFSLGRKVLSPMRGRAEAGDEAARTWKDLFLRLGGLLRARIE